MTTDETIRHVPARAPRGCNQQVITQITPAELEQLDAIAQREMRSRSATLRMLMLRGIEQYEDDTLKALM
jgi:hypothetical protein